MTELPTIAHVTLTVGDLDRSVPWYGRVFGVTLVRDERPGPCRRAVWLIGGRTLVGRHRFPDPADTLPFDERRTGLDHLAFACSGRDALEAWAARLDELGIPHGGIVDADYGHGPSFRDPDKHRPGVLRPPSVSADLRSAPVPATPNSITFDTTLHLTGNNTGIVVPDELIEQLGAGRRPPVEVDLNGFRYRTTVGVMGGRHLVSVSAAVRRETGLRGNDAVQVTLTVAETPREVEIPDDLETALAANPSARTFFATLSNSLQRLHIDNINGAKTAETRQRRIDKSIGLFLEGRKR